jgi:hypothetical protein
LPSIILDYFSPVLAYFFSTGFEGGTIAFSLSTSAGDRSIWKYDIQRISHSFISSRGL